MEFATADRGISPSRRTAEMMAMKIPAGHVLEIRTDARGVSVGEIIPAMPRRSPAAVRASSRGKSLRETSQAKVTRTAPKPPTSVRAAQRIAAQLRAHRSH